MSLCQINTTAPESASTKLDELLRLSLISDEEFQHRRDAAEQEEQLFDASNHVDPFEALQSLVAPPLPPLSLQMFEVQRPTPAQLAHSCRDCGALIPLHIPLVEHRDVCINAPRACPLAWQGCTARPTRATFAEHIENECAYAETPCKCVPTDPAESMCTVSLPRRQLFEHMRRDHKSQTACYQKRVMISDD